jgi:GH24 family phage-related lysozyme (muramidase)
VQGAARELVARHEDTRSRVYDDGAGHPTVGIGFNLDRADARAAITNLGVDYDALRSGAVELTEQQITQLFDRDLNQAVAAGERTVSNFNELPANVQLVVIDMVFNLGEAGFSRFANAIAAIEAQDFQRAAAEMQDSAWYRQTGTRAQEDVRLMEYQANDGGTP